MPLRIEDRLGQVTTTEGTGAYTTSDLIPTFRSLNAKLAINDYFYGYVEAVDANGDPTGDWEVGRYTKTAENVFARSEIHSSSNNDAAVNWPAGDKRIVLSLTAYQLRYINAAAGPVTTPTEPPPTTTQPRPFNRDSSLYGAMTFRSDFDGASIDSAKWPLRRMWYEGAQYANRGNMDVSNGALRIWATPFSSSEDPTLRYPHEGGFGYVNHNATICTDGVFWQRYGYFEARIKMPNGKGPFPAFWLYGHADENGNEISARPEIDIVECYPSGTWDKGWSTTDNRPINHVCTVWQGDGSQTGYRKGNDVNIWNIDLSADYHRYGVHWDSTGYQFTFDGVDFGTKILGNIAHPLFIVLDYWMGGESGYANDPIGSLVESSVNSMEVDYVYAWALADGSTYTRGTAVEANVIVPPATITDTVDWYGNSTVYGWDPLKSNTANEGDPVATPMPAAFHAKAPTTAGVNRGVNGVSATNALEGTGGVPWANWAAHIGSTSAKYVILQYREKDTIANLTTKLTTLVQQAKAAGKIVFIQTEIPSLNSGELTHTQIAETQRQVALAENVQVIDLNRYMSDYMTANGLGVYDICPDSQHPTQAYYTQMGQWAKGKFMELISAGNITVKSLTSGASGTAASSFTTASVTPEPNKLMLLAIQQLRGTAANPQAGPTISGNGITWDLVEAENLDATTGGYFGKFSLFRAMPTAGGGGTPTPPPEPPPQSGVEHWVSPTGNDTTGTGTEANPYLTITKALSLTNPGDTVILKDGTYTYGTISITRSGTQDARIMIKAQNKWGAKIASTSGCQPAISVRASWIILKDLELGISPSNETCTEYTSANVHVRGWNSVDPTPESPSTGWVGLVMDGLKTTGGLIRGAGLKSNQDYSIIRNCVVDNVITTLNTVSCDVYNNTVTAQDKYGCSILCKGGIRGNRVFNNIVYNTHTSGQGITIGGYSCDLCHYDTATNIEAYNSYAFNNVVINTSGQPCAGLILQGASNCGFFNNVTVNCQLAMLYGGHNTGPQASNLNPMWKNNIVVGAGGSYISNRGWVYTGTLSLDYNNFHNFTTVPSQAHPINGDPLFVDPMSDWTLTSGSPCRNAGTPIAVTDFAGAALDCGFDKNYVPRGTNWDLGLYDYSSVSAGPLTISFAAQQLACTWSLVQLDKTNTSGVNGAGAIVQAVKSRVDDAATLTLTPGAFVDPQNACVAFFAATDIAGVPKTFTPDASFVEVHDIGAKYSSTQTQFKNGSATTVTAIASGQTNLAGIAVEVKKA